MVDCKTCELEKLCDMPEFVKNDLKKCATYTQKKPQTNADRIRSMSDEELADENLYFISEHALKEGFHYTGLDGGYYKTAKEAVKANLQWLKSEVKE